MNSIHHFTEFPGTIDHPPHTRLDDYVTLLMLEKGTLLFNPRIFKYSTKQPYLSNSKLLRKK